MVDHEHGATGGASLAHSSAPAAGLADRGAPEHSAVTSPHAIPSAIAGAGAPAAETGPIGTAAAGRHRRVFRRQPDPGRAPRPLGHSAIRVLLAAQLLSAAGDQVARVAVAVLVYQLTGSALITAGAYAVTYLPPLIGVHTAGRLGAAIGRRSVIIGTDLVRAVLIAVIALPGIRLAGLFGLLAGVTVLGPIYAAAHARFLREQSTTGTVPRPGPARTAVIYQTCQAAGFLAGGVLVAALQPRHALVIDALTFVVSALVIDLLARPRAGTHATAAGFSEPATWHAPGSAGTPGSGAGLPGGQPPDGQRPCGNGHLGAGSPPQPEGTRPAPERAPAGRVQPGHAAADAPAGRARMSRRAAATTRSDRPSALRVALHTLLTAHPGARIVVRSRKLRILTMFGWLAGCYVVPECLAIPYARSLGGGPMTAGLLMAAMPAGAALGTFALSGLFGRRDRMSLLSDRALLACLPLIACALRPPLWAVVTLWLLSGVGASYQLEALAAFLRELPGAARSRRARAAASHARSADRATAAGQAAAATTGPAGQGEPSGPGGLAGQSDPAGGHGSWQNGPAALRRQVAVQGLAIASAGAAGDVTGGAPGAAGYPAVRALAFVQGGMLTAQCAGFAAAGALAQLIGPQQAVAAAGLAGLVTAALLARAWRRALLSPGRPRTRRAGVPGRRSARDGRGARSREASRSGSC